MDDVVQSPSTGEATDNDDVAVTDDVGGVLLLEANKWRRSALIVNTGANTMRVTTDGSDPSAVHGKPVAAGGSLSLSSPFCPGNDVKAFCSTAAGTTANASEVTS